MGNIEEFLIVTTTASLGIIGYFIYENNYLSVSKVEIHSPKTPKEFKNFKILQLTDLHGKTFGDNNERLIKKIKKINPDIIVATGDMLSVTRDKKESFFNLCKNIRSFYPIYYSLGNHEVLVRDSNSIDEKVWFKEYIKKLKESDINVIDNSRISIIKKNNRINLYGITLPLAYYRRRFTEGREDKVILTKEYMNKLIGCAKKDEFNILLAHNPLNFNSYMDWGSDLTFSGHVHGGIVRLPFIKGILSPEVAFLPKYKEGLYREKNSSLVVGRGLGNSSIKFRLFNPPEIMVAELK